jgi:hypothetical protein
MFISTKTTLVPVFIVKSGKPYFHVYSETDNRYVEHHNDDNRYKFGEIYKEDEYQMDAEYFISLITDDDIKRAASQLLGLRPKADSEHPAAVIIRENHSARKEHCTHLEWQKVSYKGTFQFFANADPTKVPETEGTVIDATKNYEVYFSPISAIKAVKTSLEGIIKQMVAQAIERENAEKAEIETAKPIISKILKAQEI